MAGSRRDKINEFGKSPGLDHTEMQKLAGDVAVPLINQKFSQMLEDAMMSPSEEHELYRLADNLGVKLNTYSGETDRVLHLARTRWNLYQGNLPEADCPLMLKRGEICHGVVTATAYKNRTRTVNVGYSGVSTRIKIVWGVYYNAGSYKTGRTTESFLHALGTGHFVVTNKRVIFSSDKKNISFVLK